jgi:flagellar motor switch protein FliG
VVREFAGELCSVGLSLSDGLVEAFGFWNAKLLNKLQNEAGVCQFADLCGRLKRMSVEQLGKIFANVNMEIAAVLFSKLDTGIAVNIPGTLSGDHACKISHTIWVAKNLKSDAVDRIGKSLVAQIDNCLERAFDKTLADYIVIILTLASHKVCQEVIT